MARFALLAFASLLSIPVFGQTAAQPPANAAQAAAQQIGQKPASDTKPAQGTDSKSASKPASAGEESASTAQLKLGPLDPSVPPPDLPKNRPVIGVALGGGGALAMSDIGVLQWFEEHHIPVDVIAGTSMGSIVAAFYSTGHSIDAMEHIMTDDSVNSIFRIESAYSARNFRRRRGRRR